MRWARKLPLKYSIFDCFSSKFSKQKNAPFRGKFQGRLKMREIVSVADDLYLGAVIEGVFMHIAPLRDAHFGEAGAFLDLAMPRCILFEIFWG